MSLALRHGFVFLSVKKITNWYVIYNILQAIFQHAENYTVFDIQLKQPKNYFLRTSKDHESQTPYGPVALMNSGASLTIRVPRFLSSQGHVWMERLPCSCNIWLQGKRHLCGTECVGIGQRLCGSWDL